MIQFQLTINDGMESKMKRFRTVITEQVKKAVWLWHDNMLPRHFDTGAAIRYSYKTRTANYQKRKRKKGSPPALVYSGRAKETLLRSFAFRVTGGMGDAKGKFIVGSLIRYFWMTPKQHPNKPDEVKRVTMDELNRIRKYIMAGVPEEMRKQGGRIRRVVR